MSVQDAREWKPNPLSPIAHRPLGIRQAVFFCDRAKWI